jgi:hypothetical protein
VEAAEPGPGQHSESALQPRTKPPGGAEYTGSQDIGERHVQIDDIFLKI